MAYDSYFQLDVENKMKYEYFPNHQDINGQLQGHVTP